MNTDTISLAVKIAQALGDEPTTTHNPNDDFPEKVLIRTVTMYHTGRIVKVTPDWIVLADAAWVADVGRFHTALTTGTLNEVEPFPDWVWVNRGAIVDMTAWPHPLPREQK